MRSEPMQRAAFRIESSGCTLAGVAPGRKPYCGDRTSCSPSHGHGPRHSAWEGCRTIHLDQELSLGGGSTALCLPRLLIARPPSRPKRPLSASSVLVGARTHIELAWPNGPMVTMDHARLRNKSICCLDHSCGKIYPLHMLHNSAAT